MNSIRKQCLLATAVSVAVWNAPAMAQDASAPTSTESPAAPMRSSADYIDITANVGYSSNPFLRVEDDSEGSAFGRLSARGVHAWSGPRHFTSISGFIEGSTYFNDYGVESIFSVEGETQQKVSERVTVFGTAGFSGDLSGQLSNRFLYTPELPQVPDPTIPPPPTVEDPDLFAFAGRQYRLFGQAGASIRTSERSNVSISGGAQRVFFSGDSGLSDYTTIFGNGAYDYSLSERTTIGLSVNASHTNWDDNGDSSTILNPAFTVRTKVSEYWDISGGIGVSFSNVERSGDSDSSTALSLFGTACRTTRDERLCARVSRYTQAASSSSLVTTSSIGIDWSKRLDDKSSIQLSASVARYISEDDIIADDKTTHARLAASYSRRVNQRLSAGADVGVRALRSPGPNPDTDVSGSLFLRYRLGDLG